MLTRRHFLRATTALMAFIGLGGMPMTASAAAVSGKILGTSAKAGHKLWKMDFTPPKDAETIDTVIIGGGIAGLGAAYRLHKGGHTNFLLLELEEEAGGNAHSGKNSVSAYPWGAHYVPLLTEESRAVRKLFREFDIITAYDEEGLPIYNEFQLCSDPHERLLLYGRWQETLLPQTGASDEDHRQYDQFFARMEEFKSRRGADGRRLFAIPIDESSADADTRALDNITMKEWMLREGFTSEFLHWHVDYSCRDDYGTTSAETSAWAGIHYFAGRSGLAANTDPGGFVTWPEGNGYLVRRLAKPLVSKIRPNSLVYSVRKEDGGVTVDYFDMAANASRRIRAKNAVLAIPAFVAARLMPDAISTDDFSYAPWAVANITLDRMPEGRGAELAWDNMIYNSQLLGYVVATHQSLKANPRETVITYYWPLSHTAPADARREALARSYDEWRDIFLKELLTVHPELDGHVKSLDVWIWGHAMIRPVKNFIWGEARQKSLASSPPVFRAHSDMSGISIFEEAYTHGVRAAENVLAHLGIAFETEL